MRALSISLILITIIVTSSFGGIIDWFGGNFSENGSLSDDAKKLIETAFEGLDRKNIVDCHIHILGVSEEQSGCYANPDMKSFLKSPVKHIKYLIYLSASKSRKNNVDDEYMKRLSDLIEAFNPEGKHLIFAMDKYYEKNGSANNEKTEFYVPNDYVYELSKAKEYFIPVASVHPYRADALDELEKLANKNIRFIKWIPNCMGIDPSDTDIIPFYNVMKKRGMILISHTGNEDAVEAGDNQRFGNPQLLKLPLDCGVKVIAAHCATSGKNIDVENPDKKKADNFDLFIRMMDNPKYKDLLFGDISAITQYNHMNKSLEILLNRTDLHCRLINGSDYPLPGVNFLIRTNKLYRNKFIAKKEKKLLNEIYKYNPLMFDFVLKRIIKSPGFNNKFSDMIFQHNLSKIAIE